MNTAISYLDSYCERAGDPAFWAEPLNAVTNLFFILGALMAGRALFKRPRGLSQTTLDLWLLVGALFSIGIGSGLWHTIPSSTTVLMDVIPITFFIHVYLIACLRRLLRCTWPCVVFWWSVYFGASLAAQLTLPPDLLHGTIMYIPTYFTLMLLSGVVWRRNKAAGQVFMKMLALWTLALTFRTMDLEICGCFPLGTHFLWHSLNAWMLYQLSMVLIRRYAANDALPKKIITTRTD